jgi:hypothetical protein
MQNALPQVRQQPIAGHPALVATEVDCTVSCHGGGTYPGAAAGRPIHAEVLE